MEWIIGALIVGTIVVLARRGSSSDSSAPTPGPAPVSATECDVIVSKWLANVDVAQQDVVNAVLAEGNPAKVEEFAILVEDIDPKLAECIRRFKKGDKFAVDGGPTDECKAAVAKWIGALDAASQAIVSKAISEGDSTALEGFASVVDGANPALAECIRAMKPKIVGLPPVISAGDLLKSASAAKASSFGGGSSLTNPAITSALFSKASTPLTKAQLLAALNTCLAGSGMPADLQNHTIEVFNADPTREKLSLIGDALRAGYPAVASCIDKIPA